MMFVLKKIVSQFLLPLPAATVFFVVGLGLLWFSRRQKLGKILVCWDCWCCCWQAIACCPIACSRR